MSSSQQVNPAQPVQGFISKAFGGSDFQQKDVVNLQGRVALVTGGTGGIGYEVAKSLALAGARVIVVGRNVEHGHQTEDAIAGIAEDELQGKVDPDVEFVQCDFGSLNNVMEVADMLRQKESRLDILINNAGVGVNKYGVDSDGIERIFGVNVLGHFLFTNRLLPLIRKTAHLPNTPPPRIVSLTSNLHQTAPSSAEFKSLEEINNPDLRFDQYYGRSKLAIILYIKAMAEKVLDGGDERIFALSTHPGAVDTDIQEQFKEALGWLPGTIIKYLQKPMMRDIQGGSLSTLWAACSHEIEEKNIQGAYIADTGKVGGETSQADDETLKQNIWTLCHQLIEDKLGKDAFLPWDQRDS